MPTAISSPPAPLRLCAKISSSVPSVPSVAKIGIPPSARLLTLQKGSLVQIAPGLWRPAEGVDPASIPDVILARTMRAPDGAVRLVPAGEQWVRLDSDIVQALGFAGDCKTLLRLAMAGFIEIVRVAPRCKLLNLSSWWGHVRRVSEDQDFWNADDPKGRARHEAYCRAIAEIGHISDNCVRPPEKRHAR